MKKIIKWTSLFLVTVLICLSIVACDSKLDKTPSEVETEHTEHTGAGKCEHCGLDYFDILAQYIREKGTTGTPSGKGDKYKTTYIERYVNGQNLFICVNEEEGSIEIQTANLTFFGNSTTISFTKSALKYGEWEWSTTNISSSLAVASIEGILTPEKISPNSPVYVEIRRSSMSGSMESNAQYVTEEFIRKAINDFFIPFLQEVGHDLTPSDFGFARFED